MASDIYTRLREAEERATPAPWKAASRCVSVDDNDPSVGESGGLGWEVDGPPEPQLRGQFANGYDAHLIALTRNTLPEMLAVAVAARKVRLIEKQRDHDEDNYGEAWQTYSAKSLLEAWTELDFALSALEAKGKA